MNRICRLLLFCILCAGCYSRVEIGTVPNNADRDKAERYFQALGNVKTADEEEKLLTEFGEWLKQKGYKIRVVEEKNGRHFLSCPYFPSVTPWAIHSFLDVKNLKLLPIIDNDG
jgi:hypothetical protein